MIHHHAVILAGSIIYISNDNGSLSAYHLCCAEHATIGFAMIAEAARAGMPLSEVRSLLNDACSRKDSVESIPSDVRMAQLEVRN